LAILEPRLNDLLAEACALQEDADPNFCANSVWYGYPSHRPGLKRRLRQLVGWQSGQCEALRTEEGYNVEYEAIYGALPDCRGWCACSAALEA
jgi:hypothetical protein